MSQYVARRSVLNANLCTIEQFNACMLCNLLPLTICFVFVYRYGKFWGRGTSPSRISRRRSRYTGASHSLFPSTTGYLVQRRTQNSSQQSNVSFWICWVAFSYSVSSFFLSANRMIVRECFWGIFVAILLIRRYAHCYIASRCVSECVYELVEVFVCCHLLTFITHLLTC